LPTPRFQKDKRCRLKSSVQKIAAILQKQTNKKLPSVNDFKKKRKRAKKSKFMPDKPRSRIKKGNEKKPQLSQK